MAFYKTRVQWDCYKNVNIFLQRSAPRNKENVVRTKNKIQPSALSYLQFDTNLIEGEPYNRLALKNKSQLNVAQQNSNIPEMWETGLKNPSRRTVLVWGPVRCHWYTDFFAPAHPPVSQKTALVNFKHKIMTWANYTESIGTGYTSHDKEICLHG